MQNRVQYISGILSPLSNAREILNKMAEGIRGVTIISSGNVGIAKAEIGQVHPQEIINNNEMFAVIDGEFYNGPALRAELSKLGYIPSNDFESLFIQSYKVWGIDCFQKFNGIFAVALWDATLQKLFLVRSPQGIKPLFYHFDEKTGLTFSSQLSAIFQRHDVSRSIKQASLHEFLRFLCISCPNTIYENTFSLQPGFLESDGRTLSVKPMGRYKSESSIIEITDNSYSFDKALAEFERLLTASVERRLDLHQTGVFLSGGIDSSTLCAIAARLNRPKVQAVTVGFEEENIDEVGVATRIAEYLGVRHHELYFNNNQYLQAFHEMTSSFDQPFGDPATIPTLLASKYCSEHFQVVIDGSGADGLFGVMPPRYVRLALKFSSKFPRRVRRTITEVFKCFPYHRVRGYTPLFDFDESEELLITWNGWSSKELEGLCETPCSLKNTRFYKLFQEFKNHSPFQLYSILYSEGIDDENRVFESASHYGLTVRLPFEDLDVVTFVRSLHGDYKYQRGIHKYLLRLLLGRHLPIHLWDRPKHFFNFPLNSVLKFNNYELLRLYLDRKHIKQGYFSDGYVAKIVKQYMQGQISLKFKIWALIVFQAWYYNNK